MHELTLQALYRYRSDIGWLNSVEPSEEIPTAQINTKTLEVLISPNFALKYILSCEDMAFILAHESAHRYVAMILASTFELNWRYSILIQRGWDKNFLEDFFINHSQFHAIQSNIPERFYAQPKDWKLLFLQRLPKKVLELKVKLKLNDRQQLLIDSYLSACVQWYKTNALEHLYDLFIQGCDFFLTFKTPPPNQPDEPKMVEHERDKELEELDAPSGSDLIKVQGALGKDDIVVQLNIPYVTTIPERQKAKFEAMQQSLNRFGEAIATLVKQITDSSGYKRIPGWTNPDDEELLSWEVENYIPWTEPQVNPEKPAIKLIFDISGSMFQYLALLNWLRELLNGFEVEYFTFSKMIASIAFKQDHAESITAFGTYLTPVLELIDTFEGCCVIIVSDGDWVLDRSAWPESRVVATLQKNRTILFQPVSTEPKHIPKGVLDVQRI